MHYILIPIFLFIISIIFLLYSKDIIPVISNIILFILSMFIFYFFYIYYKDYEYKIIDSDIKVENINKFEYKNIYIIFEDKIYKFKDLKYIEYEFNKNLYYRYHFNVFKDTINKSVYYIQKDTLINIGKHDGDSPIMRKINHELIYPEEYK